VREGLLEVHQHAAFAPLYLRKRAAATPVTNDAGGPVAPLAGNEG
jgi:hypothetical protein